MLHGQLAAQERDSVLKEFRLGHKTHLISTNVLARGINVPTISMVINYDLPRFGQGTHQGQIDTSTYIHRVGRCTRWKNRGIAINLISNEEVADLATLKKRGRFDIEKITEREIEQLEERLKEFRKIAKTREI